MTEERPSSIDSYSMYSTEFSATPTPEPYSPVSMSEAIETTPKPQPQAPKMGILLPSGPLPPQQSTKRQLSSTSTAPVTQAKEKSPRRQYARRCVLASPTTSVSSSSTSKKSTKVTPKKRGQNRKVIGQGPFKDLALRENQIRRVDLLIYWMNGRLSLLWD